MGRGANGNYRLADRLHTHLLDVGPQTVMALKDWYNNEFQELQRAKNPARRKKLYNTVSSNQIAGVLSRSPLFNRAGEARVQYPAWGRLPLTYHPVNEYDPQCTNRVPLAKSSVNMQKSKATLWEALPVEYVVNNMLIDGKLPTHSIRKSYPRVIKVELKERGLI